jgi:hypothetical protein
VKRDGLIRARPGVYGRQPTPEEKRILTEFAKKYVEDAPKRAAQDAATLKRLMKRYRREHPEFFKGKE